MEHRLRFAIAQGRVDEVALLLNRGININFIGRVNKTCFQLALRRYNKKIIELLLPSLSTLHCSEIDCILSYCIDKNDLEMIQIIDRNISCYHYYGAFITYVIGRRQIEMASYMIDSMTRNNYCLGINELYRYLYQAGNNVEIKILDSLINNSKLYKTHGTPHGLNMMISFFFPIPIVYDTVSEKYCIELLRHLVQAGDFYDSVLDNIFSQAYIIEILTRPYSIRLTTGIDFLLVFLHHERFNTKKYLSVYTNILAKKYGIFFLLDDRYNVDILKHIIFMLIG